MFPRLDGATAEFGVVYDVLRDTMFSIQDRAPFRKPPRVPWEPSSASWLCPTQRLGHGPRPTGAGPVPDLAVLVLAPAAHRARPMEHARVFIPLHDLRCVVDARDRLRILG